MGLEWNGLVGEVLSEHDAVSAVCCRADADSAELGPLDVCSMSVAVHQSPMSGTDRRCKGEILPGR